ncbi:hypothetical protein C8R47DRAFT_975143 [Mycena vitilis]|nr:hypothetical protein C8R47DRAFT_975143 [Mycena vitilis]
MSTRARTRTTSTAKPPSAKPAPKSKQPSKPKRSEDIENDRPKSATKTKSKRVKSPTPTPAIYCLCRTGDDGSPMVYCEECDEWYHFACVGLNEDTAGDIVIFVCKPCEEKTGRRTVSEYPFRCGHRVVKKHHVVYHWAPIISRDETFICILAPGAGIWLSHSYLSRHPSIAFISQIVFALCPLSSCLSLAI